MQVEECTMVGELKKSQALNAKLELAMEKVHEDFNA